MHMHTAVVTLAATAVKVLLVLAMLPVELPEYKYHKLPQLQLLLNVGSGDLHSYIKFTCFGTLLPHQGLKANTDSEWLRHIQTLCTAETGCEK